MTPPKEILIKSDGNVLEFVLEKKGVFTYRYTKSKTKKGELLEMDEQQLNKIIKLNS